jgi:glycosyltransferase involved in cell wall biosynthesis
MRVAVVIPARDEETALPAVLDAIPPRLVEEVVVVDNASRDGTAAAARSRGATLLFEARPGYGAACLCALAYLAGKRPDAVVFLDADGSADPGEIPILLGPIERDETDLVLGARDPRRREPGALPPHARAGNWLATRLLRLRHGARFSDLGPFRAIRFDSLLRLDLGDPDFGWTAEMQVKAVRRGLRIAEVPVSCRRRRGGVSKISGSWSGSVRAGAKILATVLRPGR